jgi:hypothetical protein
VIVAETVAAEQEVPNTVQTSPETIMVLETA